MKKNFNKKIASKIQNGRTDSELLEISQKGEKDLQELDRIAKLLIRRDLELTETREKKEAEFKELEKVKAELEDAKGSLEIKVNARTKELKELTEGLDKQVKERTKELQKKMEELEKMNKLMIGRELRMVELKKEIQEFKKKLAKYERH